MTSSRSASAVLMTPATPAAMTSMPDVALRRAEGAEAGVFGRHAESAGQRFDFDRVAERRRGAVRFDVGDRRAPRRPRPRAPTRSPSPVRPRSAP